MRPEDYANERDGRIREFVCGVTAEFCAIRQTEIPGRSISLWVIWKGQITDCDVGRTIPE